MLQQLNAEKKKREVLLADTKYNSLQKKLETEGEEMELTKDEHREIEDGWKKMLETSEAQRLIRKRDRYWKCNKIIK